MRSASLVGCPCNPLIAIPFASFSFFHFIAQDSLCLLLCGNVADNVSRVTNGPMRSSARRCVSPTPVLCSKHHRRRCRQYRYDPVPRFLLAVYMLLNDRRLFLGPQVMNVEWHLIRLINMTVGLLGVAVQIINRVLVERVCVGAMKDVLQPRWIGEAKDSVATAQIVSLLALCFPLRSRG